MEKLFRNPGESGVRTRGRFALFQIISERQHLSGKVERYVERFRSSEREKACYILNIDHLESIVAVARANVLAACLHPQQPRQQIAWVRIVAIAFDSGRANDGQPFADNLVQPPFALGFIAVVLGHVFIIPRLSRRFLRDHVRLCKQLAIVGANRRDKQIMVASIFEKLCRRRHDFGFVRPDINDDIKAAML